MGAVLDYLMVELGAGWLLSLSILALVVALRLITFAMGWKQEGLRYALLADPNGFDPDGSHNARILSMCRRERQK